MFEIKYYCSGKCSGRGYCVARAENNKMIPATFQKSVNEFICLDSFDLALFCDGTKYHLMLLDVEHPEKHTMKAVDDSGARIKINILFSVDLKNEDKIRTLFSYIFFNYAEFAHILYEAYDFSVPDSIGYSFNEKLINDYIKNYVLTAEIKGRIRKLCYYGDYCEVDSVEFKELLENKLPSKDGVFFAHMITGKNTFETFFDREYTPWYVLNEKHFC